MEERLRQNINEHTFGDKFTPVLTQIEYAILERQVSLPGDIPCYGKDAIMSAMAIFIDVLLDKAVSYWERLNLTPGQMEKNAKKIGDELRLMILRYADYDTLRRK